MPEGGPPQRSAALTDSFSPCLGQGRLDLYYTVLVVLSVLNILFFVAVARFYKYKKVRCSWHPRMLQQMCALMQ